MNDLFAKVGSFLSIIRESPIWLLSGITFALYMLLFAPGIGDVNPKDFRSNWGVEIWSGTLLFTSLTLTRAIDVFIISYRARRKKSADKCIFRLEHRNQQSWWALTKQQDDSYTSQVSIQIEVTNLTDRPVRIANTTLIKPRTKGEVLMSYADITTRNDKDKVPPYDTALVSLSIIMRGILSSQGKPIRATIRIIDQYGAEHFLNRIEVKSHQLQLPKLPLKEQFSTLIRKLITIRQKKYPELNDFPPPLPEWQHQGEFEKIDIILKEEKRNYVANGRISGGLGSLNVGIRSEPAQTGTASGKAPLLLFEKNSSKHISSRNLDLLMKLHIFESFEKCNIEKYLISHLHKNSPFADVAYFIFLALHRMGRTVDALKAARTCLAGDKVHGYSNLLGALSAIISHEHHNMRPDIYPQILEVLKGDEEYSFSLIEKINCAQLQDLGSSLDKKGMSQA